MNDFESERRLRFAKQPLYEVLVRLAVEELLPMPFTLEHHLFGKFQSQNWRARHRGAPLESFGRACLELEPNARAFEVFRQTEASRLSMIIQPNLLGVRWFGPPLLGSAAYPGFDEMLETTSQFISSIQSAPGTTAGLSIRAVNITYSNYVQSETYASVGEIGQFIQRSYRPSAAPRTSLLHEFNNCWKEPNGIDYRCILKASSFFNDCGWELICSAGELLAEPVQDPRSCMSKIHCVLIDRFEALLSKRAKRKWEMQ